MTWLSNVFADNSDLARLIAVLVTGFFAISALLINQYFSVRKSRRELLIGKIEEIFQSSISYERSARDLLKAIYRGGRDQAGNFALDQTFIDAMNLEVEKLEMLFSLYFPDVNFRKEDYYAGTTLPILEIAVKEKKVSDDEALSASEDTRTRIQENTDGLKRICSLLMKANAH